MKESVTEVKHTWLVGAVLAAIAAGYFFLLGASDFPEPGKNIVYDLKDFEDLDNIETKYTEAPEIVPGFAPLTALAVANGNIYVAGKDAIAVYGPDNQQTARHGITGQPDSLGVASDGTMYAGIENTVAVYNADGSPKATWNHFTERSYITAIAIKGEDIFVADAGKRVVYRMNPAGVVQNRIGEKDPKKDVPGLEVPSPYLDLAINPDGDLWIVNPGKLGLERYQPDGSIVTSWYRPSLKLDGFPGCCNPTNIAFDSRGELYTAEKGLVRIKSYEVTAGGFDGLVAASELFPRQHSVEDIAVDARDRILVLDSQRNAIRVFVLKETPNGTATPQPQ